MPIKQKSIELGPIEIRPIVLDTIVCHILGKTPLIMHRPSQKERAKLLMGGRKKNEAERAATLKHDPLDEYRQSMYLNRNPKEPALVHFPSNAFSQTISAACRHMPGATQSQIAATVSVVSDQVNIFGVPVLGMDVVRNSGIGRQADIRTRPYFVEWACVIEISFMPDLIGAAAIMNLLNAGGNFVGLGDWRPEKGKGGTKGKFAVVAEDNKDFLRVMKQGRAAQEAAFKNPTFYDDMAQELYAEFYKEAKRREKVPTSSVDVPLSAIKSKRGLPPKNGKVRSIAARHGEEL